MPRGLFIVFEGLDRSGKSSQAQHLYSHLLSNNVPCKLIRFPARDSGAIGSILDAYLANKQQTSDEAIHLLFSANRWELRQQILADLANGVTVICDRYFYSGVVYSATKGLAIDWCKAADVGLPQPDVVLFLNVSPAVAKSRGDYGAERYEKAEFQEGVRRHFEHFATLPYWQEISADGSMEEVKRAVEEVVMTQFERPRGAVAVWRGEP